MQINKDILISLKVEYCSYCFQMRNFDSLGSNRKSSRSGQRNCWHQFFTLTLLKTKIIVRKAA